MAENGYLIIADITGYTRYLSESELDHATEIIESLINSIVAHIHPPMIISRTEGDAVFFYTLEECFLQGQTLLEALEHIYFGFSSELEHMQRNTTCTCNACANMPDLDLKMVVNHGEFMLQKLAGQTELVGSDVNATFRLGKNQIIEKTGVESYAFFSQSAIDAMNLAEYANINMVPHAEEYEHVGHIPGHVYNLKSAWDNDRDRRRIKLTPEEVALTVEFDLPISEAMAWDYLNDPVVRAQYLYADRMDTTLGQQGRMAVGDYFHCAHGEATFDQLILDWQPFEYVTFDHTFPLNNKLNAIIRFTIELEPIDTGVMVRIQYAEPRAEGKIARFLMNKQWKEMKAQLGGAGDAHQAALLKAIEINAHPEMPKIKLGSTT